MKLKARGPLKELYSWCSVPFDKLTDHPDRRVPFRLVKDAPEMGKIMARDLINVIVKNNGQNRKTRVIVPCGPKSWYTPFSEMVNKEKISLKDLFVFHMDECLDWQGRLLPKNHPYNFWTSHSHTCLSTASVTLTFPSHQRFFFVCLHASPKR